MNFTIQSLPMGLPPHLEWALRRPSQWLPWMSLTRQERKKINCSTSSNTTSPSRFLQWFTFNQTQRTMPGKPVERRKHCHQLLWEGKPPCGIGKLHKIDRCGIGFLSDQSIGINCDATIPGWRGQRWSLRDFWGTGDAKDFPRRLRRSLILRSLNLKKGELGSEWKDNMERSFNQIIPIVI